MKIVLDTGCIDFYFHDDKDKYKNFREKIINQELSGNEICVTIINYAERISGLNKWIEEIKLPKKEMKNPARIKRDQKIAKIKQIKDFFRIIEENRNVLYLSKKTAEIFANLQFRLKNNNSNNVQKGELKSMHNDIWIASLYIEHSCKFYTSNIKDFKKIKKINNNLNFEHILK